MKKFEEWWRTEMNGDQCGPWNEHTSICGTAWRAAYESIKKELEYPTNLDGIDAFIDEELNE